VSYTLGVNTTHKNNNSIFTIAIVFMAILLHQSQVLFGVNISFADIFCGFIFVGLVFRNQVRIPFTAVSYYLAVSIVVLVSSVYFVPSKYMFNPGFMTILSEYSKLVAIFVYFILGYNLERINLMETAIKWYSLFGVIIGGLGVFFTVFSIGVFSDILFYAGTRYRGLMIDPNYFAILQIAAFVYISRLRTIKLSNKYLALIILLLSVLTSGSKTGLITLVAYLTLRSVENILIKRKKVYVFVFHLMLVVFVLLLVPLVLNLFQSLVGFLGSNIPSFSRVQLLFTDISGAISENGSGRDITWRTALHMIELSPLIGIGIGSYSTVAFQMFHSSDISHNTFLQVAAEWGIPLACILFFYILFLLGKATVSHNPNQESHLILRDILIILLIGSMAISLNNARILWFVLGALVFSLNRGSNKQGGK
jgi:O-antigen ligase